MLMVVFRPSLRLLPIALVLILCRQFGIAQDGDAKARFEQGNDALRKGNATDAVRDFQEFLRLQPNSAEGYFNLGLALQSAGQLNDSLVALRKAASLEPGLHGVRLFTGIVNYKLNHLSAAHDELVSETRLEPRNAAGWMWLGVVELAQEHAEAAAAALDKAVALDPTNLDILYHRGRAHLLISKESYSAMFKLSPDSSRVYEVLGQSDAEAYRPDDAIADFQLAIRAAPHQPGLHEELGDANYYLGKGEVALGKNELAIEHFRLATNPQGTEQLRIMSWYQLATLYRNLHRTQEAGEALAAFVKMKAERDQRQEKKFKEQARRRDQLPQQETIPATADLPSGSGRNFRELEYHFVWPGGG